MKTERTSEAELPQSRYTLTSLPNYICLHASMTQLYFEILGALFIAHMCTKARE